MIYKSVCSPIALAVVRFDDVRRLKNVCVCSSRDTGAARVRLDKARLQKAARRAQQTDDQRAATREQDTLRRAAARQKASAVEQERVRG